MTEQDKQIDIILFKRTFEELKEIECKIWIFLEKFVRENKICKEYTFYDYDRYGDILALTFTDDNEMPAKLVRLDVEQDMKIIGIQDIVNE